MISFREMYVGNTADIIPKIRYIHNVYMKELCNIPKMRTG